MLAPLILQLALVAGQLDTGSSVARQAPFDPASSVAQTQPRTRAPSAPGRRPNGTRRPGDQLGRPPAQPVPPTQPAAPLRRRGQTREQPPPGQLHVGGWLDGSYTASTDRNNQLPMGFNYRANQFLLQQNWVRIERAVRQEADDPSFGFLSDTILPGSDYRFTLPRGIFNRQLVANHGQPNLYGIDPVRFYAEGYFPGVAQGMDVKIGRFYAPWGIEAVDAPSNTFLSHTYTFVYDPFTQTGIMATTKLNQAWSSQSALVLGNDEFITPGNQLKFSGNLQWASPDRPDTLRFSTIIGSPRYRARYHLDNLNLFELIYSLQINPKLKYTFATTFGYQTNVPGLGIADWIGYQNYLTRELTEKLTAALRVELFDDFKGQRTGFAGLYTDVTAGMQIQLTERIRIRPELRFDNNSRSRPFEGRHSVFTAATDVIIRW